MTNDLATPHLQSYETRFISTADAASILGVSVATVRRLAERGVLRAYRFVRRLRFRPHEVVAAAEAARQLEGADPESVCR